LTHVLVRHVARGQRMDLVRVGAEGAFFGWAKGLIAAFEIKVLSRDGVELFIEQVGRVESEKRIWRNVFLIIARYLS